MSNLTTEEMLSFMRNFISTEHDYDPIFDSQNGRVIGCFNTKYHGNMCQAIVNGPIKEHGGVSYPSRAIAYELMADGDILICDEHLDSFRLIECLGDSLSNVFDCIKDASELKAEYERNTKMGEQ